MQNVARRVFAFVLCLTMCFSLFPAQIAFAVEETEEASSEEYVIESPEENITQEDILPLTEEEPLLVGEESLLPQLEEEETLDEIVTEDAVEEPAEPIEEEAASEEEDESEEKSEEETEEVDAEQLLRSALDNRDEVFTLAESITLTSDLVVDEEVCIELTALSDAGITVAEGVSLTVNGTLTISGLCSGISLNANSALIIEGSLNISGGALITDNDSGAIVTIAQTAILNLGTSSLTVAELVNNGTILAETEDKVNCGSLSGEGIIELVTYEQSEEQETDAAESPEITTEEELRQALLTCTVEDVLSVKSELAVEGELLIPETAILSIDGMLTVNGKLTVNGTLINNNCLAVSDELEINGKLYMSGELNVSEATLVTFSESAFVYINIGSYGDAQEVKNAFDGIATDSINVTVQADTTDSLFEAAELCESFASVTCSIGETLTVDKNLAVPANMTIDFCENGKIELSNAVLTNEGTLLSNGSSEPEADRDYITVLSSTYPSAEQSAAAVSGVESAWVNYYDNDETADLTAEDLLRLALGGEEKYIFIRENVTLTADLEIPDEKVVILCAGIEIDLSGYTLTGELYDEVAPTLFNDGGYKRRSDGELDELDRKPAYAERTDGQWGTGVFFYENEDIQREKYVSFGSTFTTEEAPITTLDEGYNRFAGWVLIRNDGTPDEVSVWTGKEFEKVNKEEVVSKAAIISGGAELTFDKSWLNDFNDLEVTINENKLLERADNHDLCVYYTFSPAWIPQALVELVPINTADDGTEAVGNVSPIYKLYDVGAKFTDLPTPSAAGYEFGGWLLDGEPVDDNTVVPYEEYVCLTASWKSWANSTRANGDGWSLTNSGSLTVNTQEAMDAHEWSEYAKFIKSVQLGEDVKTISERAFYDCSALTEIDLSNSKLTSFGAEAFAGSGIVSIVVPGDIPDGCFRDCIYLTSVTLKIMRNGTVGSNAFSGCTALQSIDLDKFIFVGENAFSGCTALSSLNIANGVSVMQNALLDCTKLKTVKFNGSADEWKSFTSNLPSGNDTLKKIKAQTKKDVTSISIAADKSLLYNGELYLGLGSSTTLTVQATPADAWPLNVKWDIYSNFGRLNIDENGILTGLKECNNLVYATVNGDSKNYAKIAVRVKDYRIKISGDKELDAGDKTTLTTNWVAKNNPETSLVWKIANEDAAYASVDSKGVVTAKNVSKAHEITVIAETKNGQGRAEHKMMIYPLISSINVSAMLIDEHDELEITPIEGTLKLNINDFREGGKYADGLLIAVEAFPADINPENDAVLVSTSSSLLEASITEGTIFGYNYSGELKYIGKNNAVGKASLKFTTLRGKATTTVNVEFVNLPTEIVIGEAAVVGGKTSTLNVYAADENGSPTGKAVSASSVNWSIKNAEAYPFASIKSGKLTLKQVQEPVTFTVCADLIGLDAHAERQFTVYPMLSFLQLLDANKTLLNASTVYLDNPGSLEIDVKALPFYEGRNAGELVTIKHSKTGIVDAQFDEEGKLIVTALKNGTTKLTLTANDGSKIIADVTIIVNKMVRELTAATSADTLLSGAKATLTANDNGAKVTNLLWSFKNSGDSLYAKLDAKKGILTANTVTGVHEVTVYAEATDGSGIVSNELTVTIMPKKLGNLAIMHKNSYLEGTVTIDSMTEDMPLTAYLITDTAQTASNVTWKSSSVKTATVDENGLVHFTGQAGSVTITAQDVSNAKLKATASFKVVKMVKDFTIVPTAKNAEMLVYSGKSLALKAVDDANKTVACTWSVEPSASTYVKISTSGSVTANKSIPNAATITVTATAKDGSGLTRTADIQVLPASTAVTVCVEELDSKGRTYLHDISGGTFPLDIRQTKSLQLHTNVYPSDASQAVTWKSSSTKIATIDADGKVDFLSTGTVTFTATTADSGKKTATVKMTVILTPDSMSLAKNKTYLAAGKSVTLTALLGAKGYTEKQITNKNVVWAMEYGLEAATITSKGVLKAKAVTSPHIISVFATSEGNPELLEKLCITVLPAVTSLKLYKGTTDVSSKTVNLAMGKSVCIDAKILPVTACGEVEWTLKASGKNMDIEIAEASKNGVVIDAGSVKGKATLSATAKDGSGKKASVTINVK